MTAGEPKTVNEAVKREEWKNAMVEEVKALKMQDTFELIPKQKEMKFLETK